MQYSSIVNHIRNGNFSLWDFTNGFGTSMYQMNLFSPTLWLVYLPGILFGPQVMPGCLIYVHILTMLLAALAAWSFLSCFNFSNKGKFLAAYLYAFNGFLTVWGTTLSVQYYSDISSLTFNADRKIFAEKTNFRCHCLLYGFNGNVYLLSFLYGADCNSILLIFKNTASSKTRAEGFSEHLLQAMCFTPAGCGNGNDKPAPILCFSI